MVSGTLTRAGASLLRSSRGGPAAARTEDGTVSGTTVTLRLGADPLELPEPFAALARQLPRRRGDGPAERLPTRWLFSGGHADKPVTASSLRVRLATIGIHPRWRRLAAIDQLAGDVPPAMPAGVLGLKPVAIAHPTGITQGQWANCAARRALWFQGFTHSEHAAAATPPILEPRGEHDRPGPILAGRQAFNGARQLLAQCFQLRFTL
jgi:hypothetical protein